MQKFYRVAFLFLIFSMVSILLPTTTYANHFRAGTMSWSSVDEDTVLIKVNVGWTNTHGHIPQSTAVGDVVTNKLSLNYGDGQSENLAVRVVSRNTTTNDVQTEVVSIKPGESDYTAGVLHTYASDGNYIVNWGSSARETARNQDGSAWRNETLVTIGGTYGGNNSPIGAVPAVFQVLDNTVFTTDLIAVDVDGDPVRFRYGTIPEFYNTGSGTATAPTGLVLDADGSITWDVTNGTLATNVGDRWQGTIMVEDLDENGNVKSRIPLDFVFLISSSSDLPPNITGPSATSYTINPNEALSFSLTATDPDWSGGLNSPTIIALNPASVNNTIWSTSNNSQDAETTHTVTFTPPSAMAGQSFVVIFQATDHGGNSALKVVTIQVNNVTPTPTSQPVVVSNSQSSPPPNAPICPDSKPGNAPDLFQIDAQGTKATFHFSPALNPVTNYFIAYGYNSGDTRFGTPTGQGSSTGVLSYTIQDLSPQLTYVFKIRAQNGCMTGDWSNEMTITTPKEGSTVRYYKNFASQVLSFLPKQTTILGTADKKTLVKDDHNATGHDHCSYRVNSGDSLWSIAVSELGSGTKYTEIMEHNNLTSDFIQVGQKLEFTCKK